MDMLHVMTGQPGSDPFFPFQPIQKGFAAFHNIVPGSIKIPCVPGIVNVARPVRKIQQAVDLMIRISASDAQDVPEGIWRNAPAVQTTDGKGELRPCRRGNGSGGAGYRYGGGKQACCGRQFP